MNVRASISVSIQVITYSFIVHSGSHTASGLRPEEKVRSISEPSKNSTPSSATTVRDMPAPALVTKDGSIEN